MTVSWWGIDLTVQVCWGWPATSVGSSTWGDWDDITTDVRMISTSAGRSDTLDAVVSGTMTIEVRDDDRVYDPTVPANGHLLQRHPIRVVGPMAIPIWHGYIDEIEHHPDGPSLAWASLRCVDGASIIADAMVAAPAAGLAGVQIHGVMTQLGATIYDLAQVGVGVAQLVAPDDARVNALDFMRDCAAHEFGRLYWSRSGGWVHDDRSQVLTGWPSSVQLWRSGRSAMPAGWVPIAGLRRDVARDLVRNHAVWDTGEYVDSAAALDGRRTIDLSGMRYRDQYQPEALGRWLVACRRVARPAVRSIVVNMRAVPAGRVLDVLQIRLGSMVEISDWPQDVGAAWVSTVSVESISHQIDAAGSWTIEYGVVPRAVYGPPPAGSGAYFKLDDSLSLIGGPRVIGP